MNICKQEREEKSMKLGFIGCGNMASAMIGGIIAKGLYQSEDIIVSDALESSLEKAKKQLRVNTTSDNKEVVAKAEIIVLSVKPQFYEEVIEEISREVREEQLVITIAPGKTLKWLDETFGKPMKLIRCMPNTPALVGEGITGVCPNENVTTEELNKAGEILNCFGSFEVVPEHLMDVVVSVSGSSPAYVFMFIEAMADAAVEQGMPRAQAYKFAAQAVMGSAKMVLETGKHPGELKDMVCSPAGTTIKAVRVLEKEGLRSAVIEAMDACADAAKGM